MRLGLPFLEKVCAEVLNGKVEIGQNQEGLRTFSNAHLRVSKMRAAAHLICRRQIVEDLMNLAKTSYGVICIQIKM